jgi:Rrf2 family protein
MFSQTVEYALRAAVSLAATPDTPQTSEQVAERTLVPRGYLSKVLQQLVKANLIRSQRGLHGGFTLVRSPDRVTILEVINAVDPIRRIQECPLGLEAHSDELCPLHRRLDDALASIEEAFGQTTLAEVVSEPSKSQPLCNLTVEGNSG